MARSCNYRAKYAAPPVVREKGARLQRAVQLLLTASLTDKSGANPNVAGQWVEVNTPERNAR